MIYYQNNAQHYFNETVSLVSISKSRGRFLSYVPQGSHILDLGCGSGRDSLYFKQLGYTITAFDQSKELAELAEKLIAQPVVINSFQTMDYNSQFDAIWACASLLHCPKAEIVPVFRKVIQALKPKGIWYMSFKFGMEETIDSMGRFFNNYTLDSLQKLIQQFDELTILESWLEETELRDGQQKWVNTIVQKREK